MNEKRLSDDDDFRCRPSLGVAKLTSPRCSPSDERVGERGGEYSLPPFPRHVPIPLFVPSPPPPPRRYPRCSTPPLETRPSSGVEHVLTLFSVPLGSRPLPPPARPPGVEIYSLCPTLRVATQGDVISKQLVAKSIQGSLLSPCFITKYVNCKRNFYTTNNRFSNYKMLML